MQYNEKQLCIWSLAKVIRDIKCHKEFDCYICSLDKALNRIASLNKRLKIQRSTPKGKKGQIVHWKETFLTLPLSNRPCIYSMKNKIPFRPCINEYECARCEFNQYFEDIFSVYTEIKSIKQMDVKGLKFPHGYYLSKHHTWVKLGDSSTAIIGMDDFVNRFFGPFKEVKPPVLGKKIKKGERSILIKRHDSRSSYLCAPISGIIIDVNPNIWDGPVSKQDPYTKGWMVKIQADMLLEDVKNLLFEEEIQNFLSNEVELFYREVEKVYGPITADGGEFTDDIFSHMPKLDWEKLSKKFLRHKD